MTKYILCLLLITSSIISKAQLKTWTGYGNGISWTDANNWSPIGVPGSTNIAYITNDSVRATGDILILGLVLDGHAILNYSTTSSFEFIIDGSTSDGVILRNEAKLYVNNHMIIRDIHDTGLKMEGENQLIIGNNGMLEIEDVGVHGIEGSILSSIENNGAINISDYDNNGLIASSLTNIGSLSVAGGGIRAAVFIGALSENYGQMDFGTLVSFSGSADFINKVNASFVNTSITSIYSSFTNRGTMVSDTPFSNSLVMYSYGEFHNYGDYAFKYSGGNNIILKNNSEVVNHVSGVIHNMDSTAVALDDVYAISLDDAGTSLVNDGTIDLNLNNVREGIQILDGGSLSNTGQLNINHYYKKGLYSAAIGSDKQTIENFKFGVFNIGEGALASSRAMILEDGNILNNRECSDFFIQDSLELTGTSGTLIYNYGFMQIEGLKKDAGPDFNNTGALSLTASELENGLPSGYLDQFGNGGLIYSKNPNEIMAGQRVQPLFAGFNSGSSSYLSNIQVSENGALVDAGSFDTVNNSWKPNQAAEREDVIFVTYKLDNCQTRILELPFYKNPVWDCNSAPAANVTFLGSIDTDWHNPDNWSNNEVPRACDKVIIPNGERCEISTGNDVEAKSILVETGAYFLAPEGVIATFDPN